LCSSMDRSPSRESCDRFHTYLNTYTPPQPPQPPQPRVRSGTAPPQPPASWRRASPRAPAGAASSSTWAATTLSWTLRGASSRRGVVGGGWWRLGCFWWVGGPALAVHRQQSTQCTRTSCNPPTPSPPRPPLFQPGRRVYDRAALAFFKRKAVLNVSPPADCRPCLRLRCLSAASPPQPVHNHHPALAHSLTPNPSLPKFLLPNTPGAPTPPPIPQPHPPSSTSRTTRTSSPASSPSPTACRRCS